MCVKTVTRWVGSIHPLLGRLLSPDRTLLILAVLLASGCGEGTANGSGIPHEDTVRVLYQGTDVTVFSPAIDDTPKFLLFEPLVTYEAGSCDASPIGGLAAAWERSEDLTRWRVRLRGDARWHDGTPVTARDVAWNVRLWHRQDVAWYGAAGVDSVAVVDSLTLEVFNSRPSRWPLEGWDVFYPRHLLAELPPEDFFEWDFWRRPVGNGPFRFVREVPQELVELEANPEYHGGSPEVDRVILLFRTGTPLTELRAGNVDIAVVPALEAAALADDPRFHLYYWLQGASEWLIWNHTAAPFRDVRARRAMALAIDRRSLLHAVNLPESLPVTDAPFTPCQREAGELSEPWPHDPAAAARLLSEAGWRDSDGDGVRERDGAPFRFTTVVTEQHRQAAVFVQDQLRRVGVRMEIALLDRSVAIGRYRSGDFQAIIHPAGRRERWVVGPDSPLETLDPTLTELMARYETEPRPAKKDSLLAEAAGRYRDLVPATFLHLRGGVLAAHRRIRGLGEPGGVLSRPGWRWAFGGLPYLWVEEEIR